MSYTVSRRTREIGVRVAVGAEATDVARWILGRAARLTAAGLAIGIVAAMACSRLLQGLLFEVGWFDPTTLTFTLAMLAMVSLIAALVPARRASLIDPVKALAQDE